MIFTHLAPNVSLRDLLTVGSFFVFPWKWWQWQEGPRKRHLHEWFTEYYGHEHIYFVDSGRSALLVGLQSLGITAGDEVIVPGYTCIVVTNAIRAVGATPVLVDIDNTGNIDPTKIESAITDKTKAILAQHTFGLPCDIQAIQQICQSHHLFMIEDCAHALGAEVGGTPVGSFGDISFLSFGSDKIVSSVRGGALIVNNKQISNQMHTLVQALHQMPRLYLWKHVLYISAFFKSKQIYRLGGKVLLYLFARMQITAKIIEPIEKENGNIASWSPTQYPNILAAVVFPQLRELFYHRINRRMIASYYQKELPQEILWQDYGHKADRTYLHFPIIIENIPAFVHFMKKKRIQVGTDWNGAPIVPQAATQIDSETAHIPQAKNLSTKIVQLPIHQHMTLRKARRVVRAVNQLFTNK